MSDIDRDKMMRQLEQCADQVNKQHWLNIHFQAFEIANDAWKLHILANARTGAKQCGSPLAAVLVEGESEREG